MTTTKEKPIHEVRLGLIKASIWKNDSENGVWYTAKFSRSYKNGDVWGSSENFGRDDLLVLAKLADIVHTWIHEKMLEEREQKRKTADNKEGPSSSP
jgi:hypothetical protein